MAMTRFTTLLLMLLAAALFAVGCGGDDDSSDSDSGDTAAETTDEAADDSGDEAAADAQVLELGVDGNNLAFDKKELTAKAGSVTLKLNNSSSIQHNVAVREVDGDTIGSEGELVGEGETSETTVDLKPGTYTYYCAPHESSGMTGTLTVT